MNSPSPPKFCRFPLDSFNTGSVQVFDGTVGATSGLPAHAINGGFAHDGAVYLVPGEGTGAKFVRVDLDDFDAFLQATP